MFYQTILILFSCNRPKIIIKTYPSRRIYVFFYFFIVKNSLGLINSLFIFVLFGWIILVNNYVVKDRSISLYLIYIFINTNNQTKVFTERTPLPLKLADKPKNFKKQSWPPKKTESKNKNFLLIITPKYLNKID